MEVRKPHIKSIPYDEFKDNETLEDIARELNDGGVNVVLSSLDQVINWGRSNSLWSLTFGTSCCGIEFMAVGCARYDFSRFGFEVTRNSARQADLIMCAGTITNKMAPVFKRLYDEMAEPKYVVAVGGCTISGGPFKKSYSVVRGIDEIVPVDVYVPGCPPRPEAILYGMMQLQRKVKVEKFFGGANHKMTHEEKETSMSLGGLHGISNENLSGAKIGNKEPIIVKKSPNKETVEALGKELDALAAEGEQYKVNK
ncbi:NADH-quinone oxidoreductase subunit B [Hallella sp.]|uniref:NADH-quinone oxidoreductase subunit B n=1 Tax=Hallella sp. TaxID=2980186 RepID=UPI0028479B3C|nr:NADH-quinone oxidoreductase subunit B [Hallella sp.]MDR3845192.1 NADH-quinone oxidoreductase subunit B [Hallella sp.]